MSYADGVHLSQEKLSCSCQCSQGSQISECTSGQAGFISDTLSWTSTGLAEMGVKGKSLGGKSTRSFILRTHVFGGMGVRKIHIDG